MRAENRKNVKFWQRKVHKWATVLGLAYRFEVRLVDRPDQNWIARTNSSTSHADVLIEINIPAACQQKFEYKGPDEVVFPTKDADELVLHELVHIIVNRYKGAFLECIRSIANRVFKYKDQGQVEYDWAIETSNIAEEELVDKIACVIKAAYVAKGKGNE